MRNLAFFSLLLVVAAVSACGRAPSPKATVTLIGLNLDAAEQLRKDALNEFTSTTGIRADLIPTGGISADQLSQTLRLLNQHTTTPDVFVLDIVWTGTLGPYLQDLTSYEGGSAHNHLPELINNDTVQERLVSLPFYLNVGMLYYRTDLLKKYGFEHPPATWNELESMAAQIQKGERADGNAAFWGYVWQGGPYEGLTCNALEWQASFGGGRIIEPDTTITVNNRRTVQAFQTAANWVGRISPASVLSYTESDSLNAFRSGNAAFMRLWSGGFPPSRAAGTPVSGRFGMTLLPSGPHGRAQTVGGFHLAVSRYSMHPREAAKLVVYLTSSPVQKRRALSGGYLPTIPGLYRDPELLRVLPYLEALQNTATQASVARPSTVAGNKYAEISKAYYLAVHSILAHQVRADEALAELEKRLVELTGFRTGVPTI